MVKKMKWEGIFTLLRAKKKQLNPFEKWDTSAQHLPQTATAQGFFFRLRHVGDFLSKVKTNHFGLGKPPQKKLLLGQRFCLFQQPMLFGNHLDFADPLHQGGPTVWRPSVLSG